jgi:hypothetical protein
MKQSSLDEEQMGMEMDAQSEDLSEYYRQYEDPNNLNNSNNGGGIESKKRGVVVLNCNITELIYFFRYSAPTARIQS